MLIPFGVFSAAGAGGGAAAGSYELIQTVYPSGSVDTLTFSSIPSTYKHLQIRATYRNVDDFGGQIITVGLQMNGNTGSSYSSHYVLGNGSSASSNNATNSDSIYLQNTSPTAPNGTSIFGAAVIDILDYTSTTKNKTTRALHGAVGSSNKRISLSSGLFFGSQAAISSMTIWSLGSGNFGSGSRFSLYGVKG